jgi:multiple sugar transport system substrate-binding protein
MKAHLLRRIFLLYIVAAIIPATIACHKEKERTREETGITTLHFVTWKPNQPGAWEEILRIFHEENPNIKVIREIGPHSSSAFHDLLTQKLKNKSQDIDVFLMDVIWPPEFAAAGWAMPLDDRFPHNEQEAFLESTILANTYNGRIYGIPFFIDSGMFFYRKDLLEKYHFSPPKTWDRMARQISKIVPGETKLGIEIYGFSGQFKQYEGLVCDMMEYILSNNGTVLDPKTGKSALSEKPALDAVRFVRDRIIGSSAPIGVLTYQEPESLDLFIQGKTVFHRNWPYAWEIANNPEHSRIVGKVGITKLPYFKGGKSVSTLGGWQVGISSYSVKKEAAWKFAAFLTSPRMQKLYSIKTGKAPAREELYDDPEILKANPHFAEMKEVFLTAYPRPRSPLYPAISNILQRYFSKAISDSDSDIEKEAKEASEEIDKILSLTE